MQCSVTEVEATGVTAFSIWITYKTTPGVDVGAGPFSFRSGVSPLPFLGIA